MAETTFMQRLIKRAKEKADAAKKAIQEKHPLGKVAKKVKEVKEKRRIIGK